MLTPLHTRKLKFLKNYFEKNSARLPDKPKVSPIALRHCVIHATSMLPGILKQGTRNIQRQLTFAAEHKNTHTHTNRAK